VAVVLADDVVDKTVGDDLKTYFEGYVFPSLGMDIDDTAKDETHKADTVTITTEDELNNSVTEVNDMPYCFAIYVNQFDIENHNF
jgi:hypothetical protein